MSFNAPWQTYLVAVRREDILWINTAVPQYTGLLVRWWWHIVTTLSRYWRHQPSQPRRNNQLNIYDAALSLILHVIDINILNIEIKTEHISNVYISYKDWDEKARLNNINFYKTNHTVNFISPTHWRITLVKWVIFMVLWRVAEPLSRNNPWNLVRLFLNSPHSK